jgi:hypothetical protein
MNYPHQKNSHIPCWCLLFCFISLCINIFIVIVFYWYCKADWTLCQINPPDATCVTPPHEVFFGKVIGFYEILLYFQFGIIGVLLVLSFLYSHFISKRHAREILDDEIYSEHFRKFFGQEMAGIGRAVMTELFANNELSSHVDNIDQEVKLLQRNIAEMEQAIENPPVKRKQSPRKIQNTKKETKNGTHTKRNYRNSKRSPNTD